MRADENEQREGSSVSNQSHAVYAVTLASAMHKAAIPGQDGKVVDIGIITPYAAMRDTLYRELAQLAPQEICNTRVKVLTGEISAGHEFNVTIVV